MAPTSNSSGDSSAGESPGRDEQPDGAVPARTGVRANLDDFSDDESEAGEREAPRAASPVLADADGNIEVEEAELEEDDFSGDEGSGNRDPAPATPSPSPPPPPPVRRRGPSHKRAVVDMPRAREHLTLMQLPPAIDVPLTPSNPVKDPLPQNALTTIMYRLKKGVTRAQVESAMEERGALRAMPMIAESNTRLVTWSDGSRTLMVGDEHFSVMDDKQTPESLYVFRKGKDVQSYYGQVGKYVRVQPSMVSKKRNSALLALSGGAEANSKGRTMLRQIDGLDEKEAKARHEAAIKRSREQSRRQAKQRRISERAVHPEARLTRRALEDDDDDDDEEEEDADFGRDRLRNRWEEERGARKREEEREARLRESKRAAAAEERVDVVRRRKLGSRRVVDDNDDDDDDDDDED